MNRCPYELLILGLRAGDRERVARAAVRRMARLTDVRVVDAVMVITSRTGAAEPVEIAIGNQRLIDVVPGLISAEDVAEIGSILQPGTGALAVLVEHLWLSRLTEDGDAPNGSLVAALPVPAEWVRDAGRALAARGEAA